MPKALPAAFRSSNTCAPASKDVSFGIATLLSARRHAWESRERLPRFHRASDRLGHSHLLGRLSKSFLQVPAYSGVESDGRVHSGSSVIEVDYQFWRKALRGLVGGSSGHGSVTGQAVVIDLGARGALVAALGGLPGDYCVVSALSLVGRAYEPAVRRRRCVSGYPLSYENERALANESGSVELTRDNLPAFIWFADKADSTWRQVEPSDFPTVIGDATRLVSAQIEITHEPVVIDIDKKLPAYTELRAKSDSWRQFVSEGDK